MKRTSSKPIRTERPPSTRGLWWFVLKATALILTFYAIWISPWFDRGVLLPFLEMQAAATAEILRWFGSNATATGARIESGAFEITVRRGCDGVEATALVTCCLLAFPGSWRLRLAGIAAGALAIQLLNLLRLLSLFVAGSNGWSGFDFLHLELWPVIFVVFAVGFWLAWVQCLGRPHRRAIA